jgi:predicted  nucleic acid-binding Zn-ribbon protein
MTNILNNLLQLQVDVLRMRLLTLTSHISTPFERYVKKLEDQIRLKGNEIYGLNEKLSEFQQRINLVKSQQGNGNVCHNCHLRLNHAHRKKMNV